MINLAGESYSALPSAFAYRTEYNTQNNCKAQTVAGRLEIVELEGTSRTFLSVADITIPMPIRDPRNIVQTIVAEIVHVPLPRRRPPEPGAENQNIAAPVLSAELRVTEVNGRVVRLVGPDTPYAQ